MTCTLKNLIAGVVCTIAALSVGLAAGCGTGLLNNPKACEGATDKAFGTLTTLLTTLMGLAVKLDALDEPKPKTTRRVTPTKE